ncbi:MAG: molybdenum cofactor guanylyltransferase, partial [Verrucomicrobiales bacterium]|nr:molybdenum cofactor guanylyltransferase [Verrucomicrobiales bacterium]
MRAKNSGSSQPAQALEICILAGGLSSRMGRDKGQLRLGRQTLVDHIRQSARQLKVPVRVVYQDAVPRCGPLGGVYTALKRSRASAVLFLSCDMPFVSRELLAKVAGALPKRGLAVFTVIPEMRMGQKAKYGGQARGSMKPQHLESETNFASVPRRGRVGFPFVLRSAALPVVERLLARHERSLQNLAAVLQAKRVRVP